MVDIIPFGCRDATSVGILRVMFQYQSGLMLEDLEYFAVLMLTESDLGLLVTE